MSILDDLKALKEMIPCEILEGLNGLPKATTRLNSLAKKAEVKVEPEWDSVYVTGDQPGRICGYLLQTLLLYDSKFPIYVGASEKIPDFICRKTLVFIIFYLSYDADLTASLTTRINDCVAREATVVCITEEGANWDSIRQQGVEVLEIPKDLEYYLTNHYAFLIPLYLISKCGLARTFDIDAQEAGRDLERLKGSYSVATPLSTNPAKELATRLYQQPIVFLFGSFGVTDSIVRRWSGQLRKRHYLADYCVFPDASYEQPFLSVPGMDLDRKIVCIVDQDDDYRVLKKYKELADIAAKENVELIELCASGKSKLSKMLGCLFFADFVNAYLDVLRGTIDSTMENI